MFITRLTCAATLSWAAACHPALTRTPPHAPAVHDADRPQADVLFRDVMIAGDGSLPVFDNAVIAIDRRLAQAGGNIQHLSALRPKAAGRTAPATLGRILAAVAAMRPAPGQGCLVFATSHGVRHEGLYLSLRDEVLTPTALDRALVQGCGAAPTVVVISSCFSGSFARAPMTRANRVILTAARPDRTSFGCQAGRVFTVYDKCLIDALGSERTWKLAYASITACVGAEERREDVIPSEPQAWFGGAVADMPLPVAAR